MEPLILKGSRLFVISVLMIVCSFNYHQDSIIWKMTNLIRVILKAFSTSKTIQLRGEIIMIMLTPEMANWVAMLFLVTSRKVCLGASRNFC